MKKVVCPICEDFKTNGCIVCDGTGKIDDHEYLGGSHEKM